jgi:hypothetical protein
VLFAGQRVERLYGLEVVVAIARMAALLLHAAYAAPKQTAQAVLVAQFVGRFLFGFFHTKTPRLSPALLSCAPSACACQAVASGSCGPRWLRRQTLAVVRVFREAFPRR